MSLPFAFAAALGVTAGAQPDDRVVREAAVHLEQGKALFAGGHFDAAIEQFRASSALAPRADVQFYLAEAYRAKGDNPAAVRAYNAYLSAASTGALADTARIRIVEVSRRPMPHVRAWKRIIDRPLTLDQGRIGANLGLGRYGGFYRPPGQDGSWEFATRVRVGAGYGLSSDIDIGGFYDGGSQLVGTVDPATGVGHISRAADSGAATIYAAYRLAHGTSYSVAANVLFAADIEDNEQGVGLGLSARYRLSRRLAVFTGGSPIAPTYSSKLNWTFNDGGTGAVSISAGLEFQWTSRFYMSLTGNASYVFLERPRHSISTSLLTYVTLTEHVDIGAYLHASSFGLDLRVFH